MSCHPGGTVFKKNSQGRRETVSPFVLARIMTGNEDDRIETPHRHPLLRTQRLVMRPLALSDAARIQHLAGDERVTRFTSQMPYPYPDGAAIEFLAKSADQVERDEVAPFAITLSDEPDALIGVISLETCDDGGIEIGYWIGVPYWGQGLMSEAVPAVAAYAQRWRPGVPVIAKTFPENVASQRILEKAGFVRTGTGVCNAPAREQKRIEDAPVYEYRPDGRVTGTPA